VPLESSPGRSIPDTLPPLAAVASKLLAVLQDERASFREITRLINLDAAFTCEVLRLANSPVFAIRFEVQSVLHALSVLGLERLQSLVLTLALRDSFASVKKDDLVRQCWRHNLATGLGAEALSKRHWLDPSIGYTAGLLHDMGRLALVNCDSAAYRGVMERHHETGAALPDLEREVFGTDSEEIGRTLRQRWGFPKLVGGASCCQSGGGEPGSGAFDGIVRMACSIDCQAGFAISNSAVPGIVDAGGEELAGTVRLRLNMFECEFMHA
jgi:HD-like signal output (HDOD) protein